MQIKHEVEKRSREKHREILKSVMLSKSKFIFSNSEEILRPKEGIIFGLFSNNVLYCWFKTV